MKRHLPLSLLSFFLCMAGLVSAQSDRFAYAITDINKEGANWSFLRRMDLATGSFSDVLLSGNDATQLNFDAVTKKQLTAALKDERLGKLANAAFATGVAAIAYDKKNNRLYYTPMFLDQLRYVDLKTMNVYYVTNAGLTGSATKATDQSNIVTRMAIAADGNGYALTNDGSHLVRFTTGKKIVVTDLGAVVDDPAANKDVSVHNSCSSFGGDMIADDDGNLFVFSARNHVFKINIDTKIASHLGMIADLPAGFTINGAAVNDNNQILVTSAMNSSTSYVIDYKSWKASPSAVASWRTSDLANSNLLATRKHIEPAKLIKTLEDLGNTKVQLYPNPVLNKQFSIQFNLPEGNYIVQVTDVVGRHALQSTVYIKSKSQVESIQLPSAIQKGFYLVQVLDGNSNSVFSQKLMVH